MAGSGRQVGNAVSGAPGAGSLPVYISEILNGAGDVVNRRTLKPLLRDNILHDAVHAF